MPPEWNNDYAKQQHASLLGVMGAGYTSTAAERNTNRPMLATDTNNNNVQSSVADARDIVGSFIERIERLAERLCGPVSTNGALAGGKPPMPSGVFHEIEESCAAIGNSVDAGYASLARIEAHLPTTPVR